MGHTRLGELPRSRKWQEVVALLGAGAAANQMAAATISCRPRPQSGNARSRLGRNGLTWRRRAPPIRGCSEASVTCGTNPVC